MMVIKKKSILPYQGASEGKNKVKEKYFRQILEGIGVEMNNDAD